MQRFTHDSVELRFAMKERANRSCSMRTASIMESVGRPGLVFDLKRPAGGATSTNRRHGPASLSPSIKARAWRATFALLDHLLHRADVISYSMGARIAAFFALEHGERLRRAIFGGLGIHLVDAAGLPESIAEALEAPSLAAVRDPTGRTFRLFAEQTKSDRKALAACIRGSRQTLTAEQVAQIRQPVLVAVGTRDVVAGSAHALAALLPNARALDIPGRDHMLSVGDRVFKQAVLHFLAEE
jgi:pimeloyl-ACP methyl ester carboxylesterase